MNTKKYLLLICIIVFNNAFGQSKTKFKPSVELIKNSFNSEYKNPESILFIFDVVGCESNFNIDLGKELKKRFKKSKTKILFNFNSA